MNIFFNWFVIESVPQIRSTRIPLILSPRRYPKLRRREKFFTPQHSIWQNWAADTAQSSRLCLNYFLYVPEERKVPEL